MKNILREKALRISDKHYKINSEKKAEIIILYEQIKSSGDEIKGFRRKLERGQQTRIHRRKRKKITS